MMLAGAPVRDHDVLEDREQILRTLDDPQTIAFAGLRATLRLEHEWRIREGLA